MVARFDFSKILAGGVAAQRVKAGETLFREGDTGDIMFVVKSGEMAIKFRDVFLEKVGRGGIFGEMALVDGGSRSATAMALSDTLLIPIDRARFLDLVKDDPTFALHVLAVLADRLRAMNARPMGQ